MVKRPREKHVRDYGTSLEVLNGLKLEDWIVLNPPDAIENGQEVHVKEVPSPLSPPSVVPGGGQTPPGTAKTSPT